MKSNGQALIELLIALSLTALMLPALFTGFASAREGKARQESRFDATVRVREAREAVRVVRERGWSYVAINGTYHPILSGSTWDLTSGAETIAGQTRTIVIADVLRDANGAIVISGGTIDPSTKKVTITASWSGLFASSVSSSLFLTRYTNQIYSQTTEAEFLSGTNIGTTVTNVSGGEVTLGAGGSADWCAPDLSIAAVDLPKNGVANAISAIEGKVFAGTGENASGVSYATALIDNAKPPVATVSGTFDGFKTNGIFGESGYAYLATDNNAKEIEIASITTTPYVEAGYFNAPGNGNGDSVYVSGNVGYMASGSNFYTFDLTSKSGSRAQLGTVALAGTGVKIYVIGNYAYVAENSATTQLQIVDVSNPASPTVVGQAQVNGGVGKDVFVNAAGTRAYLVTASSVTQKELFILDITTKTGSHNTPIGSYETNGMSPKAITIVPGNRAIVVGTSAEEYQVVNIVNEATPVRCGGINIDTGVNGVSSVLEADGDAYSYIITGDATTELKIIEGGPGGQFSLSGTFESTTFDANTSAAFNRLSPHGTETSGTTLQYQIAIGDPVSGSCSGATFVFVGPDGTAATKFSTASTIPLSDDGSGYENPGQCVRYRTYLTSTDPSYAPVFEDMTINYSP